MNRNRTSQAWLVPVLSGTTFFYFLIFAQFGYLHLLATRQELEHSIDLILLFMGLGGILGSIYCGRKFRMGSAALWILSGFSGTGILSVLATFITQLWMHWIIGFMIGIFLSILTVSIVPVIRDRAPLGKIGIWVSAGVGGAYFFCNIPIVFQASPWDQCMFGAVACCIGAGASLFMARIDDSSRRTTDALDKTPQALFEWKGIAVISILFTLLIWFDSAAFYLIQESGPIKSVAWESPWNLWLNALTHLLGALFCGWLLDSGWILQSLVGAMLFLVAGYGAIQLVDHGIIPGTVFYLAAVSAYSTALVSYAALASDETGAIGIAGRAALVFAVAGWFGSAMGIGMARDLSRIPATFVIIILAVSVCFLVYGMRKREAVKKV